jgi:Flp pilus assembly protein TadG
MIGRPRRRAANAGTATLEFGIVAPVLVLLMFGALEFGRMIWEIQQLQLVSQQTARCVAIGSSACPTPASYAVTQASARGVVGLGTSNVAVATVSSSTSPAPTCVPPNANTMVQVTISLPFTSSVAGLIPSLNRTLTAVSCYPLSAT